MDLITILGFGAGILTTLAVVPQIVKSWQTKKVMDVSPFMYSILMLGVGLWVFYGILINDIPIIVTNSISFLLNGSMLILMLLFEQKNKK